MKVGGDPDELARAAAAGGGQAFALRQAARLLDGAVAAFHRHNHGWGPRAGPAGDELRRLAERLAALDRWVASVAAAFRHADTPVLAHRVLGLGPRVGEGGRGLNRPVPPLPRPAMLTDDQLAEVASWPELTTRARDRVQRERIRRWLPTLERAAAGAEDRAAAPLGPLDRLVALVDRTVVDRTSAVVDLHRSPDEHAAQLAARARGLRDLLAADGLLVLDAGLPDDPAAPVTARVAFGDLDAATHLAVLLPGTSTGVHAPDRALADGRSLHAALRAAASATGTASTAPAVVVDLYAAPLDVGHAASAGPATAAGGDLAAWLPTVLGPDAQRPHITLVGHSYGALTASHAVRAGAPVDELVALGAPGLGVATADELGDVAVWAARAEDDPIAAAADLDELLQRLPPRWRPRSGPLADPLVLHGPDPLDEDFGALALPTATSTGDDGGVEPARAPRGHLDYLTPGTVTLAATAAVVLGRAPGPAQARAAPSARRRTSRTAAP